MSAALDRKLHQAAAALAAGDLGRAERLSRDVLERAPRHPRALELAATVCLQQGDGPGAGVLLQRALAGDPHNPNLLEGLGVAALKAGNFVEAESWLRQAIGPGKGSVAALSWLGLALSSQERRAEAVEIFRRAAASAPQDPGVHLNLGNELMQTGAWDEAIGTFERALALQPDYPEALMSLGSALKLRGDLDGAATRFRQAIELRPGNAEAYEKLGATLLELERYAEAEDSLCHAMALAPDDPQLHAYLGEALVKQRRWSDGIGHFERALALNPGSPKTMNALGSALTESGRPDLALAPIRQALSLRPDYAEAHHNLGTALLQLGRYEEANASFRRAIELQPWEGSRHFSFGKALSTQHRWEEAVAEFERARQLSPELSAVAEYSIGDSYLFRQDFERGWTGYEQRLEFKDFKKTHFRGAGAPAASFWSLPRWRGPGEAGVRSVAIWAEQGIGDQVLFSTLLPDLIAAADVPFLYEVDRRLMGAYQRSFPQVHLVAKQDPAQEALQQADRVLSVGSLPALFRRSRADFDRQPAKLLSASPERVAHYRNRLGEQGPELKVALSWRSTRQDWWGRRKSVALTDFAPLLKLPGVQFLDVQYGDTAADRRAVEEATGARLVRFEEVDYLNDLEEVLAILEACDLLIATSSATAHFAGALGKRTWLLCIADRPLYHYWAHGGSYRCVWYPSVEIVTAPHLADWPSLIEHVAVRLRSESGEQ